MILGSTVPGEPLEGIPANWVWVSRFESPAACRLAKLSVLLDGLGPGSGDQVARAVAYRVTGAAPALVGGGDEVTVADGQEAGWVDFSFLEAHPGGLELVVGEYDLGLLAGPASGVIRPYGEPDGGDSRVAIAAYALGPPGALDDVNYRDWRLALTGAIFRAHAAPEDTDDFYQARLAFPSAQAALSSRPAARATASLTRAGWHGTSVHPERGSFAVAKTGTPYAEMVGQRVRVTTRGVARPRSVYAIVGTEADIVEEISLSRRLFLALEIPGKTDAAVVVEEVPEE